jgi:hypothetical protein
MTLLLLIVIVGGLAFATLAAFVVARLRRSD